MCPTRTLLAGPLWRPSSRHEGYQVSWTGLVRNARTGQVLRPQLTGKGYAKVHLGRALQVQVHQLVCEAWVGPKPPGKCVDHIDWTRTRNVLQNVRWLSSTVNSHRYAAGFREPVQDVEPLTDAELDQLAAHLESAGF